LTGSEPNLTAMDLFSGCGGMSIGLQNAGFRIIHANELDKHAASTYKRNFPDVDLVVRDIRKINTSRLKKRLRARKVDLIAAGPPCQGFSFAGRRRVRDPRNLLYTEVIRFVRAFRPRVVVIENVLGMLYLNKAKTVDHIMSSLRRLGYHPHWRVLVASDYGVPQARRRVFIVATLAEVPVSKIFPRRSRKKVSVAQALSDLSFLEANEQSLYYKLPPRSKYQRLMRKTAMVLFNHESPNHSRKIQRRFESIPVGQNGSEVLKRVRTGKRTFFKLDPRKVARTVTTLPEDFIHYSRSRVMTVREMARLQSIPDSFHFLGPRTTGGPRRSRECPQYTQAGNAVPPLMAERVFRQLGRVISRY